MQFNLIVLYCVNRTAACNYLHVTIIDIQMHWELLYSVKNLSWFVENS